MPPMPPLQSNLTATHFRHRNQIVGVWTNVRLCNLVAQSQGTPKEDFKRAAECHLTGKRDRALGDYLFQALQEPLAGGRQGTIEGRIRP